jgi:hypothetical protein
MQPDSVLVATDTRKSTFPAAVAGALVMSRIRDPAESAEHESRKRQLEADLRAQAFRLGRDRIGSAGPTPGPPMSVAIHPGQTAFTRPDHGRRSR